MHLERLSQSESRIVGEVLRAASDGPFFPDWEFYTLFGLSRDQVRQIATEWPLPIQPAEDVLLAVNNSLNMLLGYPHRKHEIWSDWISIDRTELKELYKRLRGHRREDFFDRLM